MALTARQQYVFALRHSLSTTRWARAVNVSVSSPAFTVRLRARLPWCLCSISPHFATALRRAATDTCLRSLLLDRSPGHSFHAFSRSPHYRCRAALFTLHVARNVTDTRTCRFHVYLGVVCFYVYRAAFRGLPTPCCWFYAFLR